MRKRSTKKKKGPSSFSKHIRSNDNNSDHLQETIADLHKRACDIFGLNSDQVKALLISFLKSAFGFYGTSRIYLLLFKPLFFQVCVWDYFSHRKHALMKDMEKTLDDANIQMDQDVSFFFVCMLGVIS